MNPDVIQALCALGASIALYSLVWALRAAHRIPRPYDGRGWR